MAAHEDPTTGKPPVEPSQVTSTSLLDRLQVQDQDAWRKLVELYGPLVYQWCRRWGIAPSDSQDVVQEVFRAVALSIVRFRYDRSRGTFRGWLWTIACNEARDHFARQANNPKAVGGTALHARLLEVPEQYPDEASRPETASESCNLMRRALAAIRGDFQEHTWQAFWRTAIDGQAAGDVAGDLGMTPRAVRQAKHRVLQRLREEFGGLIDCGSTDL